MNMADIIIMRRDTKANWATANPVLADGELGFETDTRRIKCGNGESNWNSLEYYDNKIHLTQEEYNALSDEVKNNGDWYFIEE